MIAGAVLGVHENGVAGRAGTADHRARVVGNATAEHIAGDLTFTVQHAGNRQFAGIRRGVVGGNGEDVGLRTGVASLVGRIGGELVLTLADTGGRRVVPLAIRTSDHAAQHRTVVVDGDLRAGFGLARQSRCRVIGHPAIGNRTGDGTDIVNDFANGRLGRWRGVDAEVERRRIAGVTRQVLRLGLEAMRALGQVGSRLEAPGAIGFHRGGTQRNAAIEDRDGRTGLALAVDLRTGIVGHAVVGGDVASDAADRIDHANDAHVDRAGVYHHVQRGTLATAVASCIHHFRGEGMVAFRQIAARREAPLAIGAHRGFADLGAVVVDDDLAAGFRAATEGRTAIVGGVATVQRTGLVAHIVQYHQVGHVGRLAGVGAEVPDAGRVADLPYGVGRGGGDVVQAIDQDVGGDGPATRCIGLGAADQGAAVVQLDDGATFRSPLEGRLGVVGHIAFLQEAGVRSDVVEDALDRRGLRFACIQGETVFRAGICGIACRVTLHGGQVIQTRDQFEVRLQRPSAIRFDDGCTNRMVSGEVLGVDRDGVASRTGTADHRTRVVGDTAVDNIASDRSFVIHHAGDGQLGRVRRRSIDTHGNDGRVAGVTSIVAGNDGDLVVALRQRLSRSCLPVTVIVGHDGDGLTSREGDRDFSSRLGLAIDGRQVVIGNAVTLDPRIGIRIQPNLRGVRRGSVDIDHERIRHRAGVARNIGHGQRDVMRAFGKRQVSGSLVAPFAIRAHNHLRNLLAVVVKGDDLASLAIPGERRTGIVGAVTTVQVTDLGLDIVVNLGQGTIRTERRLRRDRSVDVDGDDSGLARVACHIGGNDGDDVAAFRQRLGRRHRPVALIICRGSECLAGRQSHRNLGVWLSLTVDSRHGIAGDAITFDAGIGVGIQPYLRGIRRSGIDHHRNNDLALVTGRILLDDLDISIAIRQRLARRRSYPGTIFLDLSGDSLAGRIDDDNGVAWLPVAIDGGSVVRAVVVIAIEVATIDARSGGRRRNGIDGEVDHMNRLAGAVARDVLDEVDAMVTVAQVAGGDELPLAILPYRDRTNFHTIVEYVDDGAGHATAGDCRPIIISSLAVGQIPCDRTDLVSDFGIGYVRAGRGSCRRLGMMFMVVLVGSICRATCRQNTSTGQQRPQQEAATLVDVTVNDGDCA